MRIILIFIILAGIWSVASADTQDYVKGKIVLIRSDVAYFDIGQKDGVAPGQNFMLYNGQQVLGAGKIAWTDQNISRSEPFDSTLLSGISNYGPLIVKIRLYAAQSSRGGYLNIAYFSDLNLEPAEIYTPEDMMVARLIHRGLLTKDQNGQIQPDLCVDYEIRDLTHTFYLNPKARFHSGKPLLASDVEYSLEQLARAPKLTSASCFILEINGADDFRNGIKGEISGIYIVDDTTIAITLKRPFHAFEEYLAGPAGYIIPKPGEIATGLNVIGAGPYRMKWIDPTGLVLEPDTLNGQPVYLDSLRFVRYANPDEAGLSFELGKVDLIYQLGEPPPKFAANENRSFQNKNTDAYVVLGINNHRGYQADQKFGKALSFLLDRGSIIRAILGGSAVLPNINISDQEHLNFPLYDRLAPDSATYYLSNIFSLPKIINLSVDSSYPVLTRVARYIEGQLQNRGIKVIEKKVDLSTPLEPSAVSEIDLYITTILPVSQDPECVFYPLLSDSLSGQTNFLNYDDEANQVFLENLTIETYPDRRISLAAGLAQSLMTNPPLVVLYQPNLMSYAKPNISGIAGEQSGYPDLRGAYIENIK